MLAAICTSPTFAVLNVLEYKLFSILVPFPVTSTSSASCVLQA